MDTIRLDGGSFIGADLSGKRLIYGGGELPNLAGAHFTGATWELTDAAARTAHFLAYLDMASPGLAGKLLEHARKTLQQGAKRIPTN